MAQLVEPGQSMALRPCQLYLYQLRLRVKLEMVRLWALAFLWAKVLPPRMMRELLLKTAAQGPLAASA